MTRVAHSPDYEPSFNEDNLRHRYIDIEEFEEEEEDDYVHD